MKPKCIVTFSDELPQEAVESLKDSAIKLRPDFEFSFVSEPNVFRSVSASLEATEGAFGSIDGNESKASAAQLSGVMTALLSELRRIS